MTIRPREAKRQHIYFGISQCPKGLAFGFALWETLAATARERTQGDHAFAEVLGTVCEGGYLRQKVLDRFGVGG